MGLCIHLHRLGRGLLFASMVTGLLLAGDSALGRMQSATMHAFITAVVIATAQIGKQADLDFDTADPGDPEQLILSGDASRAAGVQLRGNAHQAYSVKLPDEVHLRLGSGNTPDTRIKVTDFRCKPDPRRLVLSAGGSTLQQIGARRGALRRTQRPGVYRGSYTLTVLYL